MNQPAAFLNGEFLPASQLTIPVADAGFVLGATVTEQVRTFAGQLFRLDEHLQRLHRSLEIVGVQPGLSMPELADAARELARRNHPLLAEGDDLGLAIFVTPGTYGGLADGRTTQPTVGIHTFPLAFRLWADKYDAGDTLVVTDVRQVPTSCWPAKLKCRSRMHYYLADRRARQIDPAARALLLDEDGLVVESSTANVVIHVQDEGLVTPPREKVLPGISLSVVRELAAEQSIPWVERDLRPEDVTAAGEVMLTSTSVCLLPVVRVNGTAVGTGTPGPIYRRLLAAWSGMAGVDVASQARRFASRP